MYGKYERDYIARHERIRNKLMELAEESEGACVSVAKIATALGMDQRTVRAHLTILEVDNAGVFVNPEKKEFCTREGINLLAKRLGIKGIVDEQEAEPKG